MPTYCWYSTGVDTTARYDFYGTPGGYDFGWDEHKAKGDGTCLRSGVEICKHWASTVEAYDFGRVVRRRGGEAGSAAGSVAAARVGAGTVTAAARVGAGS